MPTHQILTHRRLATATVLLGMFIAAMESLIGATILPSIISSLGGLDLYPWVVSCFLLALIVTMPVYGKLADHWGFFSVYRIAIIIFLTGSLFCGISQTMVQLIIARCIQGAGTAGLITLCMLYVSLAYPLHKRHKMQAFVSSTWAVASLIGPAVGAFLVAYFSWRLAFLINVPLCILLLIGGWFYLRNLPKPKSEAPFDFVGAALFTISILALLISLIEISKMHLDLMTTIQIAIALLGFAALVYRAINYKHAFIPIDVVHKRPTVAISLGLAFLGGAFLFAASSFLPIFIQGAKGESIKAVGQVVVATALGTCCGSYITAFTLSHLGFRKTSLMGSTMLTIGLIILAMITRHSSLLLITSGIFLTGVGIGMAANCAIVANQSYAHPHKLGTTTGLFSFFRTVGGLLAVSLLGTLQLSTFRYTTGKQVLSLSENDVMLILNNPELIFETGQRSTIPPNVLEALSYSLGYSIHITFLTIVPFVLLHFWLSYKLPNLKPHEVSLVPSIDVVGE